MTAIAFSLGYGAAIATWWITQRLTRAAVEAERVPLDEQARADATVRVIAIRSAHIEHTVSRN
jgi:hypothetical protein